MSHWIGNYNIESQLLLSFSMGYFLFDTYNMAAKDVMKWKEIIIHHILVILGFSVCIIYDVAFTVSLLIEVNTVFMHARTLLLMSNESRNSWRFKMMSRINILSFIIFRLGVVGWGHKLLIEDVSATVWIIFAMNLTFLVNKKSKTFYFSDKTEFLQDVHNTNLFYTLLKTDGYLQDIKNKLKAFALETMNVEPLKFEAK